MRALALIAVMLCALGVRAEQFVGVGPYQVHYVVIGTTFLAPEVARRYRLERSESLALVNISVLRDGKPVRAEVTGVARDLLSRERVLEFREVREANAVYYLANLRFGDQEHWRFLLQVRPVGHATPYPVRFEQRVYEENPQ